MVELKLEQCKAKKVEWGVSSVATRKIEKKPEQKVTTPNPKEKLMIKTKGNENDWYESAFKRFSITLNRANQKSDSLVTSSPSIKPGLN